MINVPYKSPSVKFACGKYIAQKTRNLTFEEIAAFERRVCEYARSQDSCSWVFYQSVLSANVWVRYIIFCLRVGIFFMRFDVFDVASQAMNEQDVPVNGRVVYTNFQKRLGVLVEKDSQKAQKDAERLLPIYFKRSSGVLERMLHDVDMDWNDTVKVAYSLRYEGEILDSFRLSYNGEDLGDIKFMPERQHLHILNLVGCGFLPHSLQYMRKCNNIADFVWPLS